jgi:probable rRNA maturation factor
VKQPALRLDLQSAVRARTPAAASFRRWARAALGARRRPVELSIRVVGERESRQLNARYRGRSYSTNVLSFPCEAPALSAPPLGDLVICARVVAREAKAQGKALEAHWAHMVVHGVLHLLGYDHERARDAARMEAREIGILARLGYPDPYQSPKSKAA